MGLEFARANPRAAAQITYDSRPNLKKSLKPQAAYDSFVELARRTARRTSKASAGAHNPAGWSTT